MPTVWSRNARLGDGAAVRGLLRRKRAYRTGARMWTPVVRKKKESLE